MKKHNSGIDRLLDIMAALRAPSGCPWDREQNHQSIRFHAIEEVYELLDAIETKDDPEMCEELGDLLLQIVFHCQLAKERGAFDFDSVTQSISDKLVRRHPHVFAGSKANSVTEVWTQWEKIKNLEKSGTKHERTSSFDGIPKHIPALLRVEKISKKAQKLGLLKPQPKTETKSSLAQKLFDLTCRAQSQGWSAEELLRGKSRRQEKIWRNQEAKLVKVS